MFAPDDATVRREVNGPRHEDGVQPPVVHCVLEIRVGRLHHLQGIHAVVSHLSNANRGYRFSMHPEVLAIDEAKCVPQQRLPGLDQLCQLGLLPR
jgi:hypothetical protein